MQAGWGKKMIRGGAILTAAMLWEMAPFTAAVAASAVTLPPNATIVAEGDSLTYGQDTTPDGVPTAINGALARRSVSPYPETLESMLKGCGKVVNHGFPGDQSVDGWLRWQKEPTASLTILMYGSNDALNFGNAARGKVDVATYRKTLSALVERRKLGGRAQTIILSLPPLQDRALDARLEPYRQAAKAVAELTNSPFVDTVTLLQPLAEPWSDGVHLSAKANRAISKKLASMIACADE